MTIELRDASLEARIRKQLQATGSSSAEEVLPRQLATHFSSVILSGVAASRFAKQPRSRRIPTRSNAPSLDGIPPALSTARQNYLKDTRRFRCKGSFGCIVARFATANSAQDDRAALPRLPEPENRARVVGI